MRKESVTLYTTAGIYALILEEIEGSRLIILRQDSDRFPTLSAILQTTSASQFHMPVYPNRIT
ncbi:MAG: hypothetical protein R3E79_03360 [Caldilineaceae bacterium]